MLVVICASRAPAGPLPVVMVGGLRRFFQLAVHLVEQLLGFRRVPAEIPLVGLLGLSDLLVGLRREPLRGGEIRVLVAADVVDRRARQCDRHRQSECSRAKQHFSKHGDLMV